MKPELNWVLKNIGLFARTCKSRQFVRQLLNLRNNEWCKGFQRTAIYARIWGGEGFNKRAKFSEQEILRNMLLWYMTAVNYKLFRIFPQFCCGGMCEDGSRWSFGFCLSSQRQNMHNNSDNKIVKWIVFGERGECEKRRKNYISKNSQQKDDHDKMMMLTAAKRRITSYTKSIPNISTHLQTKYMPWNVNEQQQNEQTAKLKEIAAEC